MDVQLSKGNRQVAIWLIAGVVMIVIQVVLGGITRLTGSGLSITEWKPILGTIPPLNETDWQEAFNKYQQIAQYKYINSHFTLSDFKFIYFWEWFHRIWARLIGVAFIIPFLIFIKQKKITRQMVKPLVILFLLGVLQGLVGWIMVKSGLEDSELVYVSHFKLAVHFVLALFVLAYTFWFALKLLVPQDKIVYNKKIYAHSITMLILLTLQFIWGAFMAGLKAATAAPTWPKINDGWWPANWLAYGDKTYSEVQAWFSNPLVVHFVHRNLAHIICIVALAGFINAIKSKKAGILLGKSYWIPLAIVIVQLLIGIFTVLQSPKPDSFLWLAAIHQCVAMMLLLAYTWWLYITRKLHEHS